MSLWPMLATRCFSTVATNLAGIALQQLHTCVSVVLGLDAVTYPWYTLALLLQPLHKGSWIQLLLHSTLEAPAQPQGPHKQ